MMCDFLIQENFSDEKLKSKVIKSDLSAINIVYNEFEWKELKKCNFKGFYYFYFLRTVKFLKIPMYLK
jgi:hypothetical protein